MGTSQLSPSVNGCGCSLGELLLTENELTQINSIISSRGFRFVPLLKLTQECPLAEEPIAAPSNKDEAILTRKAKRGSPARRRRNSAVGTPPSQPAVPTSKKRKTMSPAPAQPEPLPPAVNASYSLTDISAYKTTTTPVVITASRKSLIVKDPQVTWQSMSRIVQEAIERNPMAKWFMTPVHPEAEGMPDYFDKIKTPMDFQTVRQKLDGQMYKHPFRWQHDVRTIFYNAFAYHPQGSPIWRSAAELSIAFENLCKETVGVNSYAIFKRPPVESTSAVGPASAPAAPAAKPQKEGDGKITMDESQFRALLEKAASSGQPVERTQAPEPSVTPAVPVAPAPTSKARLKGLKGQQLPPGVRVKDNGAVTYTADCAGSPLAEEYGKVLPASALPPPCSVPAAQLSDAKNAIIQLSQAQKRNALLRFKELDVSYRKALLDLVKDELGIHSLLCAQDSRYLPDIDLLPPVKTRQFFLYMKALMSQQKAAQDSRHLPTTLPRPLNWNMQTLSQANERAPPILPKAILNNETFSRPQSSVGWTVAESKIASSSSSDDEAQRPAAEASSSSSSSFESESEVEAPAAAVPAPLPKPKEPAMRQPAWFANRPQPFSFRSSQAGAFGGLGKQKPLGFMQPARGLDLWRAGARAPAPASVWGRSNDPPAATVSCWGEWKAKVMQEELISRDRDVGAPSERETRAEKADAEI